MKEVDKIKAIDQIDESILNTIDKFTDEVFKAKKNKDRKISHLLKVKEILPKFEESLKEFGLEIGRVSYTKTGMHDDWRENDCMKVAVTAFPFNKKLRFLTENGFDSQGRGRNHKKLMEKAEKIENHIKEVTGLESVVVNQFSLEVNRQKDEKRVLIDFWVRAE